LVVDLGRACVTRDGQKIPVPRLSLDLLVVLLRAAPNVVSPEVLMQRVWPQIVVSPETVSQRVKLLRSALGMSCVRCSPRWPATRSRPSRRCNNTRCL
jgi:DNA-binding winged helix-turn-helix (wHTH) protein